MFRPSCSSNGTEASTSPSPSQMEARAMDLVNEVPTQRLMELVAQSSRR